MRLPIDLLDWEVPSPPEVLEAFRDKASAVFQWNNRKAQFSPLSVYCLLKSRCGKPNGPIHLVSDMGTVDQPIQWDCMLRWRSFYLHFIKTSFTLEAFLRCSSRTKRGPSSDWVDKFLSHNISEHSSTIDKEQKELEHHILFINPYKRYQRIANYCVDQLEAIDYKPPNYPDSLPVSKAAYEAYRESFGKFWTDTFAQMAYSLMLTLTAAFLAESYLNILVQFLAREEVKAKRSVFKNYIRQSADLKLQQLPIFCYGFERDVQMDDERVRDFLDLLRTRNDLVHSNLTVDFLQVGHVCFDGNIPLFDKDEPLDLALMNLERFSPTPDESMTNFEKAKSFVEYLRTLVSPGLRDVVDQMTEANPLGFNVGARRYSVLFPDIVAMFFPIAEPFPVDEPSS